MAAPLRRKPELACVSIQAPIEVTAAIELATPSGLWRAHLLHARGPTVQRATGRARFAASPSSPTRQCNCDQQLQVLQLISFKNASLPESRSRKLFTSLARRLTNVVAIDASAVYTAWLGAPSALRFFYFYSSLLTGMTIDLFDSRLFAPDGQTTHRSFTAAWCVARCLGHFPTVGRRRERQKVKAVIASSFRFTASVLGLEFMVYHWT
jgi:hypothetical protein